MRINYITILAATVWLSACSSTADLPIIEREIKSMNNAEAGILFITLSFRSEGEVIKLVDIEPIVTNGVLKKSSENDGDMICRIEKGGSKVDEVHFNNPLKPHLEIYGEGGELNNANITLDEAQITLRFSHSGGARIVKVYSKSVSGMKMLGKYLIQ